MTVRTLPRSEYPRLEGTTLEHVWPMLPEHSCVIVVEHDGEIVATWAFVWALHAHGLWFHEDYRTNAAVGRRLLYGMHEAVRAMGAQALNTSAESEHVARMLEKVGAVEIPGRHFSMRVH